MEFLRQNAAHVAAWLPPFGVFVALLSLAAFFWFRRRHRRVLRTLSFTIFLWAVIALIVMFGPMAPLFTSARRLDAWTGRPAPVVAFRDVAGGAERRLTAYTGRVVLVNLWATWCPPCREELPDLNRLQKAYAQRGLVVVTLSDESPDRLTRFLRRHAPDTVNGVTSFEWLPVKTFRPFTFVIDRQGVVREFFFGSQEYTTFEQKIQPYL